MLLTEYDEKKHMRNVFKDGESVGYENGYEKGKQDVIENLVRVKLEAGKNVEVIAAELEMEIEDIKKIVGNMR